MAEKEKKFDPNSDTFYSDLIEALDKGEITEKEYTRILFPSPEEEKLDETIKKGQAEKGEVKEEEEEDGGKKKDAA